MDNGWIKLHRRLMEWEWYTDSHMVHLLIHLAMHANHEERRWKGLVIKRGQVVTGRIALSAATGISEQSVRTCLDRLKETGEITIESTNQFSLITLNNYEKYQLRENDNQQPNQRVTNNQPATNHKQELQELKELKKRTVVRPETDSLFASIENLCSEYGIDNQVNRKSLDVLVGRYVSKVRMNVELQHCVSWLIDKGLRTMTTQRLGNWFKKSLEIQKREENRSLERKEKIGGGVVNTKPFQISPDVKARLQM